MKMVMRLRIRVGPEVYVPEAQDADQHDCRNQPIFKDIVTNALHHAPWDGRTARAAPSQAIDNRPGSGPYPRGRSPFQLSSMVTPLGSRTKICFTDVPGVVEARNLRPVFSTRARASS